MKWKRSPTKGGKTTDKRNKAAPTKEQRQVAPVHGTGHNIDSTKLVLAVRGSNCSRKTSDSQRECKTEDCAVCGAVLRGHRKRPRNAQWKRKTVDGLCWMMQQRYEVYMQTRELIQLREQKMAGLRPEVGTTYLESLVPTPVYATAQDGGKSRNFLRSMSIVGSDM